ncbi:MAG: alanine racemase [Rhodospirillales bacterium]|nr:alanine racemase [Rhodospirillales bacterium]
MSNFPHISEANAGAILTIDLDAIVANYRMLVDRTPEASVAAVVKADAYGLGVDRIAPALAGAGCRVFFVAHIEEGIHLRHVLNDTGVSDFVNAEIHILGGLMAGTEEAYDASRLMPVLGSLDEIHNWKDYCRKIERPLACDIHVDTGMLRLGLPPKELDKLVEEPARLDGMNIVNVMSHLACADEPGHPKNAEQLEAFRIARILLPQGQASFANSAGIFLGADYHFDLVRPGLALYGGSAVPEMPNAMAQVVKLQGKIVQVRDVDTPQTVGYGASHRVEGPGRIATVPVGYADGFLRSLGNKTTGHIGNIPVPVVGRVSMDLITLDVSAVPKHQCSVGDLVDLIGPANSIERVAEAAGTINYEILTSLGHRFHRVYVGAG